jgi:hypothetical protein
MKLPGKTSFYQLNQMQWRKGLNMKRSYKQPVKEESRIKIWTHAISSLTTKRKESQILNAKYVQRLWDYSFEETLIKHKLINSVNEKFLDDWLIFAKQSYGTKKADELKIAYLCGPEPENDLKVLIDLGIRIENVWAFESDSAFFNAAVKSIKRKYPTLKIFNGKIDTYLSNSPAKFDIIYLDFTASIFSHSSKPFQVIHSVFDAQALTELGILIVNSCFPDKDEDSLDFLSSYFFNQKSCESVVLSDDPESDDDGSYGEGADAHGFIEKKDIRSYIDKNFRYAYSAFATHYPIFYANIVQPVFQALKNPLVKKRIFETDSKVLQSLEHKYFNREEIIEEWTEYSFYSFLNALGDTKISTAWTKHFTENPNKISRDLAVKYAYMTRDAVYGNFLRILSTSLRKSIPKISNNIPDKGGGLFCDVPMIHLWLELAINQLGYVNHTNVKNHARFSYLAKTREMCVDVFTFDRCRALYDWLPMIEYYGEDLSIIERQMITRICIDAIGKHRMYILDNLYFGSALVCINDKTWSTNHSFSRRENLNK